MFSQFRQAVENLAPVPRQSLDEASGDARREPASRSSSLDLPLRSSSPMSSSQLAESALSNLRKSLATQRSGSVGALPKSAGPTPPREARKKSTLEDRLRAATFAIGEASNTTSPEVSRKPSPSATSAVSDHPLLPSSAPLSDSAHASPKQGAVDPIGTVETGTIASPVDELSEPMQNRTLSPIQGHDATVVRDSSVATSSADAGNGTSPVRNSFSTSPNNPSGQPETETLNDTDEPNLTAFERVPTPSGPTFSPDAGPSADLEPQSELPDSTSPSPDPATVSPDNNIHAAGLEEIQERLRQVEQRFTDVSTSFKRLQAEKQAADLVLRELTPLESVGDSSALRDYLRSQTSKAEIFQDEIKRLNDKLEIQEDRIEELRDTHRLESSSQSVQIEKLRTQVSEAEALLKAAQSVDSQAEAAAAGRIAEIEQLRKELERAKLTAKEEEEKRRMRQRGLHLYKKRSGVKERGNMQKGPRLRNELDAANAERDKTVVGLKAQFDKEVASLRDRHEKELTAIRGQHDLEGASVQNAHAQEISSRDLHIHSLEQSLVLVTKDKNAFFDDLQLRQAELESAQSHLESLESQNTEYQYQLREVGDRYALLKEDFAGFQREQETRSREPATSADEMARILSAAEAKYESRISDLKRNLGALEKERNDSEADWSRKLRDKTREVEDLKRLVGSTTRTEQLHEEVVAGLKADIGKLEGECRLFQEQLHEVRQVNAGVREAEKSWKSQEQDLNTKLSVLEQQIGEVKQREGQLRLGNKTLREELRKVQSSAALLERQRNPGVGYWTSRSLENNPTASQTSVNTIPSETLSRVSTPEPTLRDKSGNDEEVNLEYLRNVILQFLEHKEMRPNLVKVLSIILHFTPQETRRLIAKV
ncbi:hypothetical protein FPV67DRAFT_1465648 [Lyophyllum atratum]|nr:hypothetical protein FPV67DRAFT_1465648 [Lyophyllum atratum]